MAIPAVIQGTVEVEGKVFEFDSFKASVWLESVTSFRFEPTGASKPYTIRKESRPGGDYWYGYRKVAGKLHKKYIGKTLELNTAKLEEIAEALNTPPQPRVTDKVTHRVDNLVTHEMAGDTEADRLTALEQQVQALQESLETLRSIVLGKHEDLSSSGELSEPDEALGGQLPIDLDNLRVDNEYLKKKLAEKRDTIDCLNWGTEALNEQLAKLQVENQRLENDLGNLQAELAKQKDDYAAQLAISRQFYQEAQELRSQIEKLKTENEALRNTPLVVEFELPEASVLLNRLKAKRKKATASLADVEAILEILEG